MRYLLVSAAAVMAITGAAAIGNAQMQDDKNRGPAAEGRGSGSDGAQRAPGGGDKAQRTAPNRAEERPQTRKGAERESGKDRPRAAQNESDKDRSKSAQQPQRDKDQKRAADRQDRDKDQKKAADRKDRDKDQKRAADRKDRDKDQKRAADRKDRDKDQKKAADRKDRDKDQKRAADRKDRDKDQKKSAKGPDDKQAGRVQVSEEKRSGVRERLSKERRVDRVDRTRINVSINVGSRIPRSVRLHTLPVSIVSFAPAYRGYSYILLEDETICIIDPRTYVIVDVIPAGSQRAHLTLSPADMRFIYRTVPKARRADVRVRLALGAEVPRGVELLAFPDEVVERIPDVRRYRYIATEDDIVIVDPDDYAVALVIDE